MTGWRGSELSDTNLKVNHIFFLNHNTELRLPSYFLGEMYQYLKKMIWLSISDRTFMCDRSSLDYEKCDQMA